MRGQLPLLLLLAAVCWLAACSEKYDLEKVDFLEVTIDSVDSLSINSFMIAATIKNHEVVPIDDYGLVWSRSDTLPTLFFNEGKKSRGQLDLEDNHTFSETLELEPAASYRIIAYATIGEKIFYSPPVSNVTGTARVITYSLDYTEGNTIHLTGHLKDLEGGLKAVARGFCWSSTNPAPGLQDTFVNLGATFSNDTFETTIGGLLNDTAYHFRAYAILSKGLTLDTIWGETITFDGNLKNAWTRKAPFPGGPRVYALSFVIDGMAYVGGGRDTSGNYYNDFWQYDPDSDTWSPIEDFPGAIFQGSVAFTIGGIGYVGDHLNFYSYTPQLGWYYTDTKQDGASCNSDYNYDYVPNTASFVVAEKAYIITKIAESGDVIPNKMFEFDPATDSVRCACSFPLTAPLNQVDAVAFSIGPKAYFGFGTGPAGNHPNLALCELTPSSEQDTCLYVGLNYVPGLNSVRLGGVGVASDNKGYVGFGHDNNGTLLSDLWEFEPNTGLWNKKKAFPGLPRAAAVALSCRGRVYIGLGDTKSVATPNQGLVVDFYEFDPN